MFSAEPPLKRRRVSSTASQHPLPAEEEPSPGANEITHPNSIDYHESQPLPPQSYNGISHSSPASGGPFQSPGSWYQDGFSQDPGFLASQEELRCILFSLAYSAAPTRAPSPDAGILDRLGDRGTDRVGIDTMPQSHRERQQEDSHRSPFSNSKRIKYLKNYVTEVAPWLDMFDSQCTFRQQLPALARTFPALSYAILAFSARHMERKEGVQDLFDSLELYQEAIRLLSPVLQVRDPKIVAACVLLCCLEMMSARAQDWRRHLEGCAALFDAFEIHGFSNGLLQAVFWCYARMDLCGALISDGTQTTLLHPSKWLPPGYQEEDAYQLFQDAKSPDMHANYAVYLCMRATQLVSDRTKFVELHEQNGCNLETFCLRWVRLWDDLQRWLSERPSELLPVQTVNLPADAPQTIMISSSPLPVNRRESYNEWMIQPDFSKTVEKRPFFLEVAQIFAGIPTGDPTDAIKALQDFLLLRFVRHMLRCKKERGKQARVPTFACIIIERDTADTPSSVRDNNDRLGIGSIGSGIRRGASLASATPKSGMLNQVIYKRDIPIHPVDPSFWNICD
ncbi:hypothetical protein APSETT444_002881 [Aspergillus pseudonomiae]